MWIKLIPLDFTSSLENRWSNAFAFGAITPLIFSLFFGFTNPIPYTPPRYLKVFVYLVAALEVGFICKPFFACLSTPYQMLGGILGLLYTLTWFIMKLWYVIWCKWPSTYDDKSFEGFSQRYEWLLDIPHLLCLGFLVFRFGFIIVKDLLIRLKKCDKQVVKIHQYRYVQRLLRRSAEVSVQKCWFQRIVYDWDPYFKFPNRIIATVVLCFLGVYMIVLCEQIISSWCIRNIYKPWPDNIKEFLPETTRIIHLTYVTYSWYITSVCAAVSSVTHICHVMVYYRKHIKSLWAGDNKDILPKTYKLKASVSVAGLLKYPGYQIAFTLWGYLIVHLAMFTVALLFVYLVISPIHQYGFLPWLLDFISFLTNFFIMFILMRFQRIIITLFFLQDKNSQDKEKPLALKNRKVFHNFNYYLFFFNLILGIGSCVLRVIRSAVVALMLLSRIERTIMPQGFKKLDASHSTWVGMIITDHHHSNPVLVCFCHLLLKHTLQSV
ncbi:stimulated by retinoic acid gene 6 protein-like [Tachysurus fulvidraco]|uniref:stimulated by retinoic acid gene 6 protein-like n=1 Tax=Tachysurus fulvidraco TaxID=1234273 RepID=UPI001FEEBA83|nr:stimulated by retinoic acid gene 6 protein-like [Tachysurus fulvidraco]